MINKIREVFGKLIQQPSQPQEIMLNSPEAIAYSTMAVNNLDDKYEGKMLSVPIQFINFDVIMESLAEMNHPAVKDVVTEPYTPDDFADFPDEIAELISDYMNTRLKILVNTVIQDMVKNDLIQMSADANGVKYYTEEPNEGIDGLLQLEQRFRSL